MRPIVVIAIAAVWGMEMLKAIGWIIGIIFLIGLLVVIGFFGLIF
jgi:hypothetical protein